MAFSAVTARGSNTGQAGASTITVQPSANLVVGRLVVVTVHTDNIGTADGTSTDHSSVADNASGSQNVWRKATEKTDTDGVAADGAVVSVWYSVLKTQIATTDTITCNLAGSIVARAITVLEATITENSVEVENVGVGQGSITCASAVMNSREYFFVYAASSEGNDNSKTNTTNYVEQFDLRTGNTGDVNISQYVQTRIQTTTSSGSIAPSLWTTAVTNPISVIVAFREAMAREIPVATLAASGLAAALLLKVGLAVGSLGVSGLAPAVNVQAVTVIQVPAGSVAVTGPYLGVAFDGPTPGSIDLTGLAPTVGVSAGGTSLSPGAGSFDLTGRTPTLALGLSTPAGTVDLTGRAPILAGTVAIPAGSIALTGAAPVVNVGQSIAVTVGSVDLTGRTPALATTLAIPAGSISISGLTAQAYIGQSIAPGVGAITLSGLTPFFSQATAIPAGTIDLTGRAPSLPLGLAIPAGSIDVSGQTPKLALTVATAVGTINLSGLAPTIVVQAPGTTTIPVGVGTIDLTGRQPSLALGVAIPAGSLAITGLAPSANTGQTVAIQAGSLDLTGRTPALAFGQAVPAGSVAISGLQPSLAICVAIPRGTIDITGTAPSLARAVIAPVPVGEIALTGLAPTVNVVTGTITVPAGSITLTGLAPIVTVAPSDTSLIALDIVEASWQQVHLVSASVQQQTSDVDASSQVIHSINADWGS